eukprot:TRINITY_DN3_c0_g2_i1.p1 TRINITY_DN3_c0_g2~~TRINITY_DN3_c0_g2_i1.p1  ORF type:complete len:155 (+),score=70.32 TRINITY_DN3_c0_g2_i1:54-518(+)
MSSNHGFPEPSADTTHLDEDQFAAVSKAFLVPKPIDPTTQKSISWDLERSSFLSNLTSLLNNSYSADPGFVAACKIPVQRLVECHAELPRQSIAEDCVPFVGSLFNCMQRRPLLQEVITIDQYNLMSNFLVETAKHEHNRASVHSLQNKPINYE